jgi:hypothetical protein
MENKFGPTQEQIDEHNARKTEYMSAKLGLIQLCQTCHSEIYASNCRVNFMDYNYKHKNQLGGDHPYCYNDESDGIAWPMNDIDLEDLFDDIQKDEWWYNGTEPEY